MTRFRPCLFVITLLLLTACSQTDGDGPTIREVWIPMEDGVRLAADIYFPDAQGGTDRYPVLLEYLPYRKAESRAHSYSFILVYENSKNNTTLRIVFT
jgi:predicted acyl esterase